MNRVRELVFVETRIGAASRVRRDLGDGVVARRFESPRAPAPNDVDRSGDRRAVDVRRLRATNELRGAERPPHAKPQLLHHFVDVRSGQPVSPCRPSNEGVETTHDVLERARRVVVRRDARLTRHRVRSRNGRSSVAGTRGAFLVDQSKVGHVGRHGSSRRDTLCALGEGSVAPFRTRRQTLERKTVPEALSALTRHRTVFPAALASAHAGTS